MKTTYKVLAVTGFAGYQLGETFEAELDTEAERRALERGSIKKTKKPANSTKEETADG